MTQPSKILKPSPAARAMASPVRLGKNDQVHARRLQLLKWLPEQEWETCMVLGGYDGSHHSGDLTWMVKKGLAERKRHYAGVSGGHWRYRCAEGGRQWLAAREKGSVSSESTGVIASAR